MSGPRRLLGLASSVSLLVLGGSLGCAGSAGGVGRQIATGMAAAAVVGVANAAVEGAANPRRRAEQPVENEEDRRVAQESAREREIEQRTQTNAELARAKQRASTKPASYPSF